MMTSHDNRQYELVAFQACAVPIPLKSKMLVSEFLCVGSSKGRVGGQAGRGEGREGQTTKP